MDWTLVAVIIVGFGSTLGGTWLGHRFTVERTKLDEKRQLESKRRESSAAVADILAEWVRSAYTGEFSDDDRWRLQKTYWKNILWLDKELLDVLLPRLANVEDALSNNELIVQTRKVLLRLSEPDIHADQLNTWLPRAKDSNVTEKKIMG